MRFKEGTIVGGYILIVLLVIYLISIFGFILPILFSAKDTSMVIYGVILLITVPLVVYGVVKHLRKMFT